MRTARVYVAWSEGDPLHRRRPRHRCLDGRDHADELVALPWLERGRRNRLGRRGRADRFLRRQGRGRCARALRHLRGDRRRGRRRAPDRRPARVAPPRRGGKGLKVAAAVLAAVVLLAAPGTAAVPAPPAFAHVIVVVFENKETSAVLGSPSAPTFNAYARTYASLTRYYGVTHPSLPNYLALVSGSTHGITSDCITCEVDGRSLADTLEASGRTWKAYLEGLPRRGFLGGVSRRYAKKHDPFAYFRAVISSPARRQQPLPPRPPPPAPKTGSAPELSRAVPQPLN